jgi:tRNA(fMet)-specific endonuclease VapC
LRFLLDTNVVTGLLKGHRQLLANVSRHPIGDFAISAIVAHELFFGAYKSRRMDRSLAVVDDRRIEVLAFDNEDARQAAEIRAVLAGKGTPIGPYDLLIAGQARARDLTVITRNLREFGRVDGLRAEDWES